MSGADGDGMGEPVATPALGTSEAGSDGGTSADGELDAARSHAADAALSARAPSSTRGSKATAPCAGVAGGGAGGTTWSEAANRWHAVSCSARAAAGIWSRFSPQSEQRCEAGGGALVRGGRPHGVTAAAATGPSRGFEERRSRGRLLGCGAAAAFRMTN
jgi:hypothetical protein